MLIPWLHAHARATGACSAIWVQLPCGQSCSFVLDSPGWNVAVVMVTIACLSCMQAARKAEEREAAEAGLAGKDAFAELKKLSRSDLLHHNDPREDLERLYRQPSGLLWDCMSSNASGHLHAPVCRPLGRYARPCQLQGVETSERVFPWVTGWGGRA